jgi:hypothetical protein
MAEHAYLLSQQVADRQTRGQAMQARIKTLIAPNLSPADYEEIPLLANEAARLYTDWPESSVFAALAMALVVTPAIAAAIAIFNITLALVVALAVIITTAIIAAAADASACGLALLQVRDYIVGRGNEEGGSVEGNVLAALGCQFV